MGQYLSSPVCYATYWQETLANSGNYTGQSFTPAVFTFDVNPDNLSLKNIEVVSWGTGVHIQNSTESKYRRYWLGEYPTSGIRFWVDTHKALGKNYWNSPDFTDLGWFNSFIYGWIEAGSAKDALIYVGAFYLELTGDTYFLYGYIGESDGQPHITYSRNVVRTEGYSDWPETSVTTCKEWILANFYGIFPPLVGDTAKKLLKYSDAHFPGLPDLFQLTPGQKIDFEFELVLNDDESIRPFTDVSFKIPTYRDGKEIYVDIPSDFAVTEGTSITISSAAKGPITYNITAIANGYIDESGNRVSNSFVFTILDNKYGEGGVSSGGIGGNGSYNGPGSSWGNGIGPSPSKSVVGDVPNGSAEQDSSRTGLFTRYGMSAAELYRLGQYLYTLDIKDRLEVQIMKFLWNTPAEALISLISYPFSVTSLVGSVSTPIMFGAIPFGEVNGNALSGTFAQIDWGTIRLEEFWGNFLDYAPHTKIDLYLPWCTGSVPIDPHECLPGSLSIKTNIELTKGTCIHNIFGNKGALIGTYSGTCGSQLPLTALDTSGKALALVTAAAGVLVAGAAAGGAKSAGISAANNPLGYSPGMTLAERTSRARELITSAEQPYRKIQKGAVGAALTSSVAAFRTPNQIVRNGSFSASGAGMGIQYPFIIISRPEQSVPDAYGHYYGYPSNVYTRLGSVSGYAEIGSIHLDGFSTATADELDEIETLLKEGVIF